MYTFGPLIAKNNRSGRLLGGAPITVTTLDGTRLDTYTVDGQPLTLVTNHEGYHGTFRADTDQRVILARPRGGDPLPLYAHEAIGDAAEAADTINTGRLSEEELAGTFATHERLVEVATGQEAALTDSAVTGALTAPGSTTRAAVDGTVAADVTDATSLTSQALSTTFGVAPEMYGAVGDGTTDDTAAFRAMLAGPIRRFNPDPSKRYRISGQLDFGRTSQWVSPLRLLLTGSRQDPGANLGVQTGGGDQHTTALFAQGHHTGVGIDVQVETSPTSPWLAIVGNDFYLHQDGARPSYPTEFAFGDVRIEATAYTQGYMGAGNACIRFQAMDSVKISRLIVKNFQYVYRHADVSHAGVGSESVTMENFRSGIQVTRSQTCSIGGVFAQGSRTDKAYVPGANALVVRAVEDFVAGDVVAHDTGEHGIRITSQAAEPGVGLVNRTIKTRASFGNMRIYRPGGCGFKAASGEPDNLPEIDLIRIGTLYVEDTGMDDYDTGGTFTGNNHFGVTLQNVNTFSASSFITKKEVALHNGKHNLLVRGARNFALGNMQAGGAYSDVIFWNSADKHATNIEIANGVGYDYGRGGTGRLLNVLNKAFMGRVNIRLNADSGPSLIEFSGASNGTPTGFWDVECTHFNVTDATVVGATEARTRIVTRSATGPLSSGETVYPVGGTLYCQGQTGAGSSLRNNEVDVYLAGASSRSFVAVAKGVTPNPEVGAKLAGTWRARGQVDSTVMVQRTG